MSFAGLSFLNSFYSPFENPKVMVRQRESVSEQSSTGVASKRGQGLRGRVGNKVDQVIPEGGARNIANTLLYGTPSPRDYTGPRSVVISKDNEPAPPDILNPKSWQASLKDFLSKVDEITVYYDNVPSSRESAGIKDGQDSIRYQNGRVPLEKDSLPEKDMIIPDGTYGEVLFKARRVESTDQLRVVAGVGCFRDGKPQVIYKKNNKERLIGIDGFVLVSAPRTEWSEEDPEKPKKVRPPKKSYSTDISLREHWAQNRELRKSYLAQIKRRYCQDYGSLKEIKDSDLVTIDPLAEAFAIYVKPERGQGKIGHQIFMGLAEGVGRRQGKFWLMGSPLNPDLKKTNGAYPVSLLDLSNSLLGPKSSSKPLKHDLNKEWVDEQGQVRPKPVTQDSQKKLHQKRDSLGLSSPELSQGDILDFLATRLLEDLQVLEHTPKGYLPKANVTFRFNSPETLNFPGGKLRVPKGESINLCYQIAPGRRDAYGRLISARAKVSLTFRNSQYHANLSWPGFMNLEGKLSSKNAKVDFPIELIVKDGKVIDYDIPTQELGISFQDFSSEELKLRHTTVGIGVSAKGLNFKELYYSGDPEGSVVFHVAGGDRKNLKTPMINELYVEDTVGGSVFELSKAFLREFNYSRTRSGIDTFDTEGGFLRLRLDHGSFTHPLLGSFTLEQGRIPKGEWSQSAYRSLVNVNIPKIIAAGEISLNPLSVRGHKMNHFSLRGEASLAGIDYRHRQDTLPSGELSLSEDILNIKNIQGKLDQAFEVNTNWGDLSVLLDPQFQKEASKQGASRGDALPLDYHYQGNFDLKVIKDPTKSLKPHVDYRLEVFVPHASLGLKIPKLFQLEMDAQHNTVEDGRIIVEPKSVRLLGELDLQPDVELPFAYNRKKIQHEGKLHNFDIQGRGGLSMVQGVRGAVVDIYPQDPKKPFTIQSELASALNGKEFNAKVAAGFNGLHLDLSKNDQGRAQLDNIQIQAQDISFYDLEGPSLLRSLWPQVMSYSKGLFPALKEVVASDSNATSRRRWLAPLLATLDPQSRKKLTPNSEFFYLGNLHLSHRGKGWRVKARHLSTQLYDKGSKKFMLLGVPWINLNLRKGQSSLKMPEGFYLPMELPAPIQGFRLRSEGYGTTEFQPSKRRFRHYLPEVP